MALLDYILGRPLASSEDQQERIGPLAGVSVFGLDALSSAAYGPEAALTILIPLGVAGVHYGLDITIAVSVILIIVYFSYRQTIAAYPQGAGSYTVAKQNLGKHAGLWAAVALLVDYTLNVAVGISAGIGALTSAFPILQPYTLILCLAALVFLAFLNLRGLRESGLAFMPPTYLFVGCLLLVCLVGIVKTIVYGGHPQAVVAPPVVPQAAQASISIWLFLKAFAAGCTAMTGVEAVSNGVPVFKDPSVRSARLTLTFIVATLIVLLLGIAYLVAAYRIVATDPGSPNYQSILSLVTAAVVGRGVFYYVTMVAILLVLCLSANTSFADFPRVCRTVSIDGFLPASFGVRGRRLVYTQGILLLTVLAGTLLFAFNGVTDRLIPLFAVGAFLAFTLSQAGMVVHWLKSQEPRARLSATVNGIGALATGITLIIVIVTKFAEGAWLVLIVLPLLYFCMHAIERHYQQVAAEIAISGPISLREPSSLIAVVPLDHLNTVAARALQAAFAVSELVHVVHVEHEDGDQDFAADWDKYVKPSIEQSGLTEPKVVVLKSPYRKIVAPTLNYIWNLERENPDNSIVVLIPQLVESHWYYSFLHNQRAAILRTVLLLKGRNRILIMDVPWHLECQTQTRGHHRMEPWDQAPAWLDR
jgi:amino acid transporter